MTGSRLARCLFYSGFLVIGRIGELGTGIEPGHRVTGSGLIQFSSEKFRFWTGFGCRVSLGHFCACVTGSPGHLLTRFHLSAYGSVKASCSILSIENRLNLGNWLCKKAIGTSAHSALFLEF